MILEARKKLAGKHLVQWGIAVGLVACVAMVILVLTMNFTFLRHPGITKDWQLRTFLFILAVFFTTLVCREFISFLAKYLNYSCLKNFTLLPTIGTFKESQAHCHNSLSKVKHAVLLLHGFTVSPQQFGELYPKLDELKLPYHAPELLGFGLNTTALLQKVRHQDWLRNALEHFDVLQQFAEEISIVGHSTGGLLAIWLATHRPVKHLILSAPAVYSVPRDLIFKKILAVPILARIYAWIVPFLPKSIHDGRKTLLDTLDDSRAVKTFQYLAVPVPSIAEFFKLQDSVNVSQAKFQSLTVVYGKQDMTIDNQKFLAQLEKDKISFKAYELENSAHNSFEDYEHVRACEIVIEVLGSNLNPHPHGAPSP